MVWEQRLQVDRMKFLQVYLLAIVPEKLSPMCQLWPVPYFLRKHSTRSMLIPWLSKLILISV